MTAGGLRDLITITLRGCVYPVDIAGVTDHLLPVVAAYVEQQARERAAAELEAIGRAGLLAMPGPHPVRVPVGYLFDRAAALRGQA